MNEITLVLTRIVGIMIISSVAVSLIPDGGCKKVLKTAAAFAVMIVILQCVEGFQKFDITDSLFEHSAEANFIAEQGEKITNDKTKVIIEEKCAAYILDKAKTIDENIELTAIVETKWNESGFWYPSAVKLEGEYDERLKIILSDLILKDLGISVENQIWSKK